MELVIIFVIIFVIYGAGWIWQTVNDIIRDTNRSNWDNRVYGQVASSRSVRRTLGGQDLSNLRKTFQRFAEQYRGQLHDRQPFESPKVSFVFRTARALLSIYESSDPSPQFYTQLTFTVPSGWPHRLEVFPQRFKDTDVKYLNVDDIRIGDEGFDPRYVVKSDDEAFTKEFLDEKSRRAVEDLRNLLGNDKILISVNSSRLMVRKQTIIGELNELTVFAELASQLYDRIFFFWQKASGIEILDDDPADEKKEAPVCQVCNFPIDAEDCVFCLSETPCRRAVGSCSSYRQSSRRVPSGTEWPDLPICDHPPRESS